jgi:hypothetical protein
MTSAISIRYISVYRNDIERQYATLRLFEYELGVVTCGNRNDNQGRGTDDVTRSMWRADVEKVVFLEAAERGTDVTVRTRHRESHPRTVDETRRLDVEDRR